MEPFYKPYKGNISAYEEYWSRIVLYLSNKLSAPRVHNVGRTFVWKKYNIFYVMMMDSWGMGPREVPLTLYNMPGARIIEISTWNSIKNGTKIRLDKYEAKFYAIVTKDWPSLVWSENEAVELQSSEKSIYYHVIPHEGVSLTVLYWPNKNVQWLKLDNRHIIKCVHSMKELKNEKNAAFYNATTCLWFIKITCDEPIGVYGFSPQSLFLYVDSEPVDKIEVSFKGNIEGTVLTPFIISDGIPFKIELLAPSSIEYKDTKYVFRGWKVDDSFLERNPVTVEILNNTPHRFVYAIYGRLGTLKVTSDPVEGVMVNYTGSFKGAKATPFELSGATPFTVKLVAPEELVYENAEYKLEGWKVDGVLIEKASITIEVSDSDKMVKVVYRKTESIKVGYPITVQSVETLDESGNRCSEFRPYDMVLIHVVLNCNNSVSQPIRYMGVVKVENPDGVMISYGSVMSEIAPGKQQEFTVGIVLVSPVTGTYMVTVYVWSDWPSKGGIPLSDPVQINFKVMTGGG